MTCETQSSDEKVLSNWRMLMLRTLRHQRVPADLAEDIVQDALLLAWRGRARVRETTRVEAWVRSIVLNRMRGHFSRMQPAAAADLMAEAVDRHRTPCEAAIGNETTGRARALFGTLTREQFQLLLLRHGHEMTPRAIALKLGIDGAVVRHRLHKLRCLLRGTPLMTRRAKAFCGLEN